MSFALGFKLWERITQQSVDIYENRFLSHYTNCRCSVVFEFATGQDGGSRFRIPQRIITAVKQRYLMMSHSAVLPLVSADFMDHNLLCELFIFYSSSTIIAYC